MATSPTTIIFGMKIVTVILGRIFLMKLSRAEIEAILMLYKLFPAKDVEELISMYKNFCNSDFNLPQYDLRSCLSRYVGYLAYSGKELLWEEVK